MSLRDVPEFSIVTKKTGSKPYTVKRSLKIYQDGVSGYEEIKCDDNIVFLVDDSGGITACPGSKEVLWVIDEDQLRYFMDSKE